MKKMSGMLFKIMLAAAILCLTLTFIAGSVHAQRFVDNRDGTITDTKTHLMWSKDASPFGRLNWNDALIRCAVYDLAGHSGWRLPTAYEMISLAEAIKSQDHPFTRIQSSHYWSSDYEKGSPNYAWRISMRFGSARAFNKALSYHVWPVRSSE